jgi:menaquinone-dependent protoporphyrinogen oxidase
MRVLVVYATHYGATKGIAEKIAETLSESALEVDLRSAEEDFTWLAKDNFDAFVIGSAIHAGGWIGSGVEFIRANADVLANRPTWLFSSGPIGDKAVGQPQPDPRQIAEFRRALDVRDHVVFGGAFDPSTADLSRVNWLERQVASHLLPVGDYRDWDKIAAWAKAVADQLTPVAVG